MKKILYFLMVLIMINVVYGVEVSEFTSGPNATVEINTTYQNFTRYVEVHVSSIFSIAQFVTNYSNNPVIACYQERANVSTVCGGLDTGSYLDQNNWKDGVGQSASRVHDADYSTGDQTIHVSGLANLYITYKKPSGFTTDSTWQVKGGSGVIVNYTIPDDCWENDPTDLIFRIRSNTIGPDTLNLYCLDGTFTLGDNPVWKLINSDGTTKFVYEEAMWWNIATTAHNFSVEVGDPDSNPEFSYEGQENDKLTTLGISKFNDITESCTCSDCTLLAGKCTIPIIFISNSTGNVTLFDINFTYVLSSPNLTVNFRDSNTFDIIDTTNITFQIWSNQTTVEKITDKGSVNISYNFTTLNSDIATLRAFDAQKNDYKIAIRQINISRGSNLNLTMYLINTSNPTTSKAITLHVQDESRNNLEGALITILQQDPSTGGFITLSELTTNANGEHDITLTVDTVFYKYLVDYKGERIYTSSNPTSISLSSEDIYLLGTLEPKFTEFYETLFESNVGLTYNETSNASGFFRATYSGTSIIEICLTVDLINETQTEVFSSCEDGTSGIIDSTTFTPANTTLYTAKVFIDYKDDHGLRFIKSKSEYIGLMANNAFGGDGSENLLLLIIPLPVAAFGFIANPVAGLILLGFSYIVVFLTKLTFMKISALMIIESFVVIAIFTVSKIKRGNE